MAIYIRVCSGPEQGTTFEIKNGIKLGRKNADFIIGDKSASSLHATIRETSPNAFVLIDNDSKNGTKIDGERVDLIELIPGLCFVIGNTEFKVVESLKNVDPIDLANLESDTSPLPTEDGEFEFDEPSIAPKRPESKPKPIEVPKIPRRKDATIYMDKPDAEGSYRDENFGVEPKTRRFGEEEPIAPTENPTESEVVGLPEDSKIVEVEIEKSWNEVLEEFAQDILPKIKNKPGKVLPFNPGLRLKFIRGVQTDTIWTLGYGPRVIGSYEYDLTLFEPGAPASCFELIPKDKGVEFKNTQLKKVVLNGKICERAILKDGDIIEILGTSIKVELIP